MSEGNLIGPGHSADALAGSREIVTLGVRRAGGARLLLVDPSADYRDVHYRRDFSGLELGSGRGQMLDELACLAPTLTDIAILCQSNWSYRLRLPSGVLLIGEPRGNWHGHMAEQVIAQFLPTHMVLQGEFTQMLAAGARHGLAVACVLDEWPQHYHRLGRRLEHRLSEDHVSLVANSTAAGVALLEAQGVPAHKLVTWTYRHAAPRQVCPRKAGPAGVEARLLFVGDISFETGVADLIRAMWLLEGRLTCRLDVVGTGQIAQMKQFATRLGLLRHVRFKGAVANGEIAAMMCGADAIVLPHRSVLRQSCVLTLREAFLSRTPILASDHPLLACQLVNGETGLLFQAGRPGALSEAIGRLFSDQLLYARLSRNAMDGLSCHDRSVAWGDMLGAWIQRDWPSC